MAARGRRRVRRVADMRPPLIPTEAREELQLLRRGHRGPENDSRFAAGFIKIAERHGVKPIDLIRFALRRTPADQRRAIAILNEIDPEMNARPLD